MVLSNKSGNPEKLPKIIIAVRKLFNYCAHSSQGFAGGSLQVVSFKVLCFKWSVKIHCVVKILRGMWQEFFYESNRNYNSYRFSDKFTFISFLTFGRNQKQVLCFEQVGGLIWFLFIASRTLLKR